jgi:hypothetical protein
MEPMNDQNAAAMKSLDDSRVDRRCDCRPAILSAQNVLVLIFGRIMLMVGIRMRRIEGGRRAQDAQHSMDEIDALLRVLMGNDANRRRGILEQIILAYEERGYRDYNAADVAAFVREYEVALENERFVQPLPPGDDDFVPTPHDDDGGPRRRRRPDEDFIDDDFQ